MDSPILEPEGRRVCVKIDFFQHLFIPNKKMSCAHINIKGKNKGRRCMKKPYITYCPTHLDRYWDELRAWTDHPWRNDEMLRLSIYGGRPLVPPQVDVVVPVVAKSLPTHVRDALIKVNPTCTICLEDAECDDLSMATMCGHVFHVACIGQCTRDECPTCRAII